MSLAVGFAVPPGDRAWQALHLARSVARNHDGPAVAHVVAAERDRIPAAVLGRIRDAVEVVVGDRPVESYPIAAKLGAARAAAERGAWTLVLDADGVLVDEVRRHERATADVLAKPVHLGGTHWASAESEPDWRALAAAAGVEFPGYVERATVDGARVPPYWNAGFVLLRSAVVEPWVAHTRLARDHGVGRYADQVGLALCAFGPEVQVRSLPERFNVPTPHGPAPADAVYLHHHGYAGLYGIVEPRLRRELRAAGVYDVL